jgi:ATP-dependent helicase HrpB
VSYRAAPSGLPVEAVVPVLRRALATTRHGVLVAPPGSGKTTIVPLRLLGEPWLEGRRIVVLEPRRLAARAAARRMADLVGEAVGGTVGYVTRDERVVGEHTRVEVVTEGVLTRRLQRDPELAGTGLVVFDELHERNLQTDLGLALCLDTRRMLRPDLGVLVMSATIDAAAVAGLLGGDGDPAPVVESEARPHPVDVRWVPPRRGEPIEGHIAATVRAALRADDGDVLVFLPGMAEMSRVADRLGDVDADVRLLHGSLPVADQDAALAPAAAGRRKVVLSTDIAETSLTVEGVRIVVDSGLARAPRLDVRTGMTRLHTVAISRASADQRAGRAGRLGPGTAYRLWSKLEHGGRRPHIDPEIGQVDLAGLALELAVWGAPDAAALPFLDPPPARSLQEAVLVLKLLGAVDEAGGVTASGRRMAALPLHPRLARMVVDAPVEDATLACVVAAVVDERDLLRGRPDEVPVDLAVRVRLVADPTARHPLAAGRSVARVRRVADDVARRAGVAGLADGLVRPERIGSVLALAFPDRLAVRRGSPGRFQLRTGTTAWVPAADTLASERFLVPADIDGKRKDARIRMAAALDAGEVAARFAHEVTQTTALEWEGDRLWQVTRRKLGGLALDTVRRRPVPGQATTDALVGRIVERRLGDLPWTPQASSYRERAAFLHGRLGEPWPDLSLPALSASVAEWLVPHLGEPTGLDDLASLDLAAMLRRRVGHRRGGDLDSLAPVAVTLASGRRVAVDYSGGVPTIAVKVQELFGSSEGPRIAGEPVLLMLLSPADRPLQITQDLAGFWAGSWAEVRREMAGRYPRHEWPADPAAARPPPRR